MSSESDKELFDALMAAFRKDYPVVSRGGFQRLADDRVFLVVESVVADTPSVVVRITGASLEDCFARLRRKVSPTPEGT